MAELRLYVAGYSDMRAPRVTLGIEGDRLTLDHGSRAERRRLVDAFLDRHGGR